jgi:hypothetical protein
MLSVAGEGVTYEYDETTKAGIENVRCGHLKLDMNHQSAICKHRPRVTDRVEMHDLGRRRPRRHGYESTSQVCRVPVVEFVMVVIMVVMNVKITQSDKREQSITRKVERVGREKVR